MTTTHDDPWSHGTGSTQTPQAAPPQILTCSFCAAENAAPTTRCGACNVEFCDWPPLEWSTTTPRSPGSDDVTNTHYGVGVIDDEDGAIALTDNPRRALAALHAYYRVTGGVSARDCFAQPLRAGWLHMEDRPDGPWHFWNETREHTARPVATPVDRPHQNAPTETLKGALALVSADAQRYAQTGPKKHENALHEVANQFLDELQARGEL